MRRLVPILSSILIGALAVAIGMGFYLFRANQDRERLAQAIQQADQAAQDAKSQSQQAILDANAKLTAANAEITKAQSALQVMLEEHDALATAITLNAPSPSALRGWKQAVNLPLGASIEYPPTSQAIDTSGAELILGRSSGSSEQLNDDRWFSLRPWTDADERDLTARFTTSTAIAYLAHGRLLMGRIGALSDGTSIFVLKVRSGTSYYLIWAKDPDTVTDHATLLKVFATLDFKS